MDMLVTKMNYKPKYGGGTEVILHGRINTGERKQVSIIDAEPYFYVDIEPRENNMIKRIEKSGVNLLNKPLWKIFVKRPQDINILRNSYEYHYEADIPFTDRIRIDYGIKTQIQIPNDKTKLSKKHIIPVERTINPETLYIDIETDDSQGFSNPELALSEVYCLSMYSTQYDNYILIIQGKVDKEKVKKQFKEMCQENFGDDGPTIVVKETENEKALFEMFVKVLMKINPDIITGWNVDNFDITTLKNRAINQGFMIPFFENHATFDLMNGYERLHIGKTFKKLEWVSQQELGVGKLPRDKIHVLFKEDKEKLALYNIWDVELTRRIDIAKNVLNRHLNFSWFAGCDLEKSYFSEPLLDKYILHEIQGRVILPSKDMLKTSLIDEGAYVDSPVKGKFNMVAVLDFASMYPNSIISCNISPETKVDETYTGETFNLPSGRRYRKDQPGFIPIIVQRLMNMRKQIKEEMKEFEKGSVEYKRKYDEQTAVKYFTNSAYGIMGSKIFRLADGEAASDITLLGRILIAFTMEEIKKMGYNPLYADTDSVFFETGNKDIKESVEIAINVEKKLNELYPQYAETWNGREECSHNIRCEKIYETWLQAGSKKRHTGLIGWDIDTADKFIGHLPSEKRMDVKGFEIKRSNSSVLTKNVQKFVILTILESEDYRKILTDYFKMLKTDFFQRKYSIDMLIPGSRSNKKYKVNPAHLRALQYSMDKGLMKYQPGDPYKWVYTNDKTCNVIAFEVGVDNIPEDIDIDYNKMWNRSIATPLKQILDAIDMNLEDISEGKKQSTLFDW